MLVSERKKEKKSISQVIINPDELVLCIRYYEFQMRSIVVCFVCDRYITRIEKKVPSTEEWDKFPSNAKSISWTSILSVSTATTNENG